MKRNILTFAALLMMFPFLNAQQPDITGNWLGKLSVGAVQLRIVFNIVINDEGNYTATMDSPDQGAKDIPMGEVILAGDSLTILAPMLRGDYKGIMVNDTSLEGTWTQSGMSYDLNLLKQTEPFKMNRPQEPQPPYPYNEENVTFPSISGDFNLGGTLTLPSGDGPFAAAILVSGSGSQNRDEEIFGHKPFKLIADYLTRGGIAVFRYDDRGVGESGGSPVGATSADLATDARSAIEYLLGREDIDNKRIGIIGHSEGGLIALKLAAENDDIAFIISLAGPGLKGSVILQDQTEHISRLSGVPEETLKQSAEVNNKIYRLLEENQDPAVGIDKINSFIREFYINEGEEEETINQVLNNIKQTINPVSYPWLRYFIMSNPADYFHLIKCPVLALNGEKDCQVIAEKNITAIVGDLKEAGNKDVTGKVLPELNHLFQHSDTGLPNEYVVIEETMSPEVLETISQWINGIVE